MSTSPATDLLIDATRGNRDALDAMLPLVYDELHRLAAAFMRAERPNHTYRPTDLVNEAYLRLIDQKRVDWRNRAQFIGIAAQTMRRVLVNHARGRAAQKRGQRWRVDDSAAALEVAHSAGSAIDLLALDEALQLLAAVDDRKRQVVELKFFGGLDIASIAALLDVAESTVERDWSFARAFLLTQLDDAASRP